ncbi:raffinose/stachyose/melibiose transport system permease protein [Inquilinus ginsengisoli]|uniref:carbohydrate ABC transporter permease n=1 Tax=Inquilinus ginsengisoli TaxID=363840 RepID=UPI003D22D5F9
MADTSLQTRRRLPRKLVDQVLAPWLFLAPAALIFAIVLVYPMAYSSWLSLFRWDGVSPDKLWVGLGNYVELFTRNRVFWIALKNNVIWSLLSLVVPTGIGLALALALEGRFRGSSFFRSVFYFPAILSMSIVGLIWSWMYHPSLGLVNQLLEELGLSGLERNWLSDPKISLYSVFAAAAWHNAGLPMLLFLAGLQTISREVLDAARIDGAGRFQRFWYVTFPLLRETTMVVVAITAINSLKVYDIIYVMTYGGPANRTQVLGSWMYFLTYNHNEVGLGTAIAVILFLLTLVFAIPYTRHMVRSR